MISESGPGKGNGRVVGAGRPLALLFLLLGAALPVRAQTAFVHPGLLQSREDLARMKIAVAAKQEPVFSGYEVFREHPQSQTNYVPHGPFAEIGRNPSVHFGEFDEDANAAFQCAIMWAITGDYACADKARTILHAWTSTLKKVSGRDAVLMAGLGPFKMINAAEILRYTDADWTDADTRQCEQWCRQVIFPALKNFALFANGNWDAAAVKTDLAIGVFCNDRAIFENALRYYVRGAGDGRLTHYIINESGQCQESGRDMPHTQLGLAHLGDCCEIAWHQGLDLYGYADNRLLKGFEYTANYNLGGEVPFTPTLDRTGKYTHQLIAPRGAFRPVYEEIYNHYVNRRGISAPFTQQAAEKIRPEGAGPGADHPGFGTLLFSRGPGQAAELPPVSPGAIVAEGSAKGVKLTWVAAVGATSYTVQRANQSAGPYEVVAHGVSGPAYTDTQVSAGQVFFYTVTASNALGESPGAVETAVSAGLPGSWESVDVGTLAVAGAASFDGSAYTIEGAGSNIGGTNDDCHFAFLPMAGNAAITARVTSQVSSQFSQVGVMMREDRTGGSAQTSLLLAPQPSGNVEAPGWKVSLLIRKSAGALASRPSATPNLSEPYVVNGRLTEPCWLRLERVGDTFTGSISADGQVWTPVGAATVPLRRNLLVGLPACSGTARITTTVVYDHVSIAKPATR
jgi:regulation of enolase protein 1 (concanavalin A-like superfamily)